MIAIGIDAELRCDEPGCSAKQDAGLVLLINGTFGFKPEGSGWQIGAAKNGAYLSYCPEHKRNVQIGPAGPRIVQPKLVTETH